MAMLLEQLGRESTLLMYLADELSADDSRDVERRLAADGAMRAELDALRLAYEGVHHTLRKADAAERIALPAALVAKRVARAVGPWHVRRVTQTPAEHRAGRLRFPWYCYPLASTAAIVIAFVSWWGLQPEGGIDLRPWPKPNNYAATLEEGTQAENEIANAGPWDGYPALRDPGDEVLDDAEDELFALANGADDTVLTLLNGEGDVPNGLTPNDLIPNGGTQNGGTDER